MNRHRDQVINRNRVEECSPLEKSDRHIPESMFIKGSSVESYVLGGTLTLRSNVLSAKKKLVIFDVF